jgi:hypothetical protein
MRDPDLAVRAQQAAAELERAWDRWRTVHGLGAEPLPPVSSYVGYSLEEPWGQPRVVFGIDAREAEQLAALLDRHDCAGPVYAAVASMAGARTGDAADGRVADADRHRGAGRVRVPTQAQPGAAQRERPRESGQPDPLPGPLDAPAQPDALPGPLDAPAQRDALPGPLDAPAQRDTWARNEGEPGRGVAGTQAQEPSADHEVSGPREGHGPEGAQPGLAGPAAFRPELEPAASSGDGQEPGRIVDEPEETAEPGRTPAGWTRVGRVPGGHALSRQKRAGGAGRGASTKQEGRGPL